VKSESRQRHTKHREDLFPELSARIIGAAIEVHRELGPGLLESIYETCLHRELVQLELKAERQVPIPVIYKGVATDSVLRADLVVEDRVIVEVKCLDELAPIHEAQLLTYLRLSKLRLGLLINFNVMVLHTGVRRLAL
jgi:GxxExxY protein